MSDPESMADVMADAARHTDQLLERAATEAERLRKIGFTDIARVITDLAADNRYWRQACHAETVLTGQLREDLDNARHARQGSDQEAAP